MADIASGSVLALEAGADLYLPKPSTCLRCSTKPLFATPNRRLAEILC